MEQEVPPHLQGLHEQVVAEIRRSIKLSNQTDTFWDNVQAFAHAVDWKEPWIRAILVGHVVAFLLVLAFRRNTAVLTGVFMVLGSLVYFGENINQLAAEHWQSFATQDYFDTHGVFYNALISGPALITLFTVLIFYLIQAAGLMVEVKKKEIIHKARQRARAERLDKKQQ